MFDIKDFESYAQATEEFAVFPNEVALDYCWLGLSNEVGELLGKYKKVLRGDKTFEEQLEHLRPETGDCYWYLAQYVLKHNVNDFNRLVPDDELLNAAAKSTIMELFQDLSYMVSCLSQIGRDSKGDISAVVDLNKVFADSQFRFAFCKAILATLNELTRRFYSTPKEIMDDNIAKLTDRKERNVLKGDGDRR